MCVHIHACFHRCIQYVTSSHNLFWVVYQVEPLSQSVLDQKPCENAVLSLQRVIQVQGEN